MNAQIIGDELRIGDDLVICGRPQALRAYRRLLASCREARCDRCGAEMPPADWARQYLPHCGPTVCDDCFGHE